MTDSEQFYPAIPAADVADMETRAAEVNGFNLVICHYKGSFYALENMCSHAREALAGGRLRAGGIVCPVHGARFDLATGKPAGPPAVLPVCAYEARVTDDGMVEVKLPAEKPAEQSSGGFGAPSFF